MRIRGIVFVLCGVLVFCISPLASAAPRSVVLAAASINPASSAQRWEMRGPYKYSLDLGVSDFEASLDLTPGTLVTSFQLEACDSSPTGWIQVRLQSCAPAPEPHRPLYVCSTLASIMTTDTDQPGCQMFTMPLPSRYKVRNGEHVQVDVTIVDSDTEAVAFKSVRAEYVAP